MPRICICIEPGCFAAGREGAKELFGDRIVDDN